MCSLSESLFKGEQQCLQYENRGNCGVMMVCVCEGESTTHKKHLFIMSPVRSIYDSTWSNINDAGLNAEIQCHDLPVLSLMTPLHLGSIEPANARARFDFILGGPPAGAAA
jgi:hypothetical protein